MSPSGEAILQQINEALKQAMKSRQQDALDALRMLKSAIKNREIEKGSELGEAELHQVIQSLVKQRIDAAEQFRKGDRAAMADKEEQEIQVLQQFLPEQLDESAIREQVMKCIQELGANSPKDMGKVIKLARERMQGQAQGGQISQIVKTELDRLS